MANHFSTIKSNATATPSIRNEQEFSGGRLRAKIARFGTLDAAQDDILFLSSFQLSDVIHSVTVYSSVDLAGGVTAILGPYLPLAATTDTPVLSPISGGTAASNRFATAVVVAGAVRPLSAGIELWGESGVPTQFGPLWEALGYTSLSLATVDIPGQRIDLAMELETANPASSVITVKIVYNAGD